MIAYRYYNPKVYHFFSANQTYTVKKYELYKRTAMKRYLFKIW